jgi:hypothetical protein
MTSKHWMGLMTALLGLIAIVFMVLFFNLSQDFDQNQNRLSDLQGLATQQAAAAAATSTAARNQQTDLQGQLAQQAATATQGAAQSEGAFQGLAATATQGAAQSEGAFQGLAATATQGAAQSEGAFQGLAATATQGAAQSEGAFQGLAATSTQDLLQAQQTATAMEASRGRLRNTLAQLRDEIALQQSSITSLETDNMILERDARRDEARISTLEADNAILARDSENNAAALAQAQDQISTLEAAAPPETELAPDFDSREESFSIETNSGPVALRMSYPADWESFEVPENGGDMGGLMLFNDFDAMLRISEGQNLDDDQALMMIASDEGFRLRGTDAEARLEDLLSFDSTIINRGPIETYQQGQVSIARTEAESTDFGLVTIYIFETSEGYFLAFYIHNGSKEIIRIGDQIIGSVTVE